MKSDTSSTKCLTFDLICYVESLDKLKGTCNHALHSDGPGVGLCRVAMHVYQSKLSGKAPGDQSATSVSCKRHETPHDAVMQSVSKLLRLSVRQVETEWFARSGCDYKREASVSEGAACPSCSCYMVMPISAAAIFAKTKSCLDEAKCLCNESYSF